MSIDFYLICPVAPRIEPGASRWLAWDAASKEGSFAGMSLRVGKLEPTDRLPDPWRRHDLVVSTVASRFCYGAGEADVRARR